MPTYTFACVVCAERQDVVMPISQYVRARPQLYHCGKPMERCIEVAPGMALFNALASERHYEGLRASDGTDIGTRAKHRQYMRDHNLTTADDFKDTWAKQARERVQRLAGEDPTRTGDIARAIDKLGG